MEAVSWVSSKRVDVSYCLRVNEEQPSFEKMVEGDEEPRGKKIEVEGPREEDEGMSGGKEMLRLRER